MDDQTYEFQTEYEKMMNDSSICAEVRTMRNHNDEYSSYLVFVVDGKSMPYLHIPESMSHETLDRILARINNRD